MNDVIYDQAVVEQIVAWDRQLEARTESTTRALMEHRWHWTLDEANPRRMSLRSYAELVGRSFSAVHKTAKGFVLLLGDHAGVITPTEAMERTSMSAETEAATEAVAAAHGIGFVQVHKEHRPEVRRVREAARQLAEERGTSVEQEAPRVAQMFVETKEAEERTEEQRRERLHFRYIEIENELDKARRHLLHAARVSEGLSFETEHRDLLSHTLDNIRRLLEMMDRAIVGQYSPDWGEALRLIEGGRAS